MKWSMKKKLFYDKISIAPLAMFRVLFGFMMLVSIIRFWYNGWIFDQYIAPDFFFTYYGFEWVKPLGSQGMYNLFYLMGFCALSIMFGFFYRITSILFFLTFTYVELIDKTNYLNHYYFVSLVSFLLIFLPAHRYFSIDVLLRPSIRLEKVSAWTINIIKFQLGLVYFYAGIAKLNYDWLVNALPLKIWLPAKTNVPLIGWLFNYKWSATVFSWCGAIYDLTIPFLLLNKYTRPLAYLAVIAFHVMTAMLFQIGMFPYIMILSTLIFFPASFHQKLIDFLSLNWIKSHNKTTKIYSPSDLVNSTEAFPPQEGARGRTASSSSSPQPPPEGENGTGDNRNKKETVVFTKGDRYFKSPDLKSISSSSPDDQFPSLEEARGRKRVGKYALITYICFQLIFPFRFLLYPGNMYWTEQGYRFSWRVMLMEKAGYTTFHIYDPETGKIEQVNNYKYLTKTQEKQMSTQPDMILQFAHFLKEKYREKGFVNPQVTAESYVTLNGRRSKPFIDPAVNLVEIEEGWGHKTWVLPLDE